VRSLLIFFAVTYAFSWTCWYIAMSPAVGPLRGAIVLLGVYAPALVALSLTAVRGGKGAVIELLKRVLRWRADAPLYLFAIGYMAAIKLTAALIHRALLGAWPAFGKESWIVILLAIPLSTPFQAGEEIGWRGFALPTLAQRFGFAAASLLLGLIWAAWHLPLFFFPGADTRGQSFPLYLLQVTAMSIAIAWLYVRTNGSLLLTMLMHSAVNQTKDIVPSAVAGATNVFALSTSRVAWISVALLWMCATYFLVRMHVGRASRRVDVVYSA